MPPVLRSAYRLRPLAVVLLAAALSSCASVPDGWQSDPSETPSATSGPLDLARVCPPTVVVQSSGLPSAEHGALYHLVGSDVNIDAGTKRVTASLIASGTDTGVEIEVRAGGPETGAPDVGSVLYRDRDVLLGEVSTDDAVALAEGRPVTAVVAPLDVSPTMLMWDPATYPEVQSVFDLGLTDVTVLYAEGATYMEYLLRTGILRHGQVEPSYDGTPGPFAAAKGKVAQQGSATDLPFTYERAGSRWGRDVAFQLVHEASYPVYPDALVVRADRRVDDAACLRRLVPIIQRSQVEYVRDPSQTNALLGDLAEWYRVGPAYTARQARSSLRQQLDLGVVGNGENATLGDLDPARVARVLALVRPIVRDRGGRVPGHVTAADLATNEFIDRSVGLPR